MTKSLHRGIVLAVLLLILSGCAGRGLVSEHYDRDFYAVPQRLDTTIQERNPAFLVYGDNQGCFRLIEDFGKQHNWWTWKQALIPFYQLYWLSNGVWGAVNVVRYSADGGKATRLMMRDVMYDAAVGTNADFILNTGDICTHDGRYPAHWRRFLIENKQQHPLLAEIPYLPTAGNHERTSDLEYGEPNFEAVFGYSSFYSVEFADAELFILDSEIICDLYSEMDDALQDSLFAQWYISGDTEHPAWLERELAACDKPIKLVAMHIPPISFGRHFRDWIGEGDYGPRIPEKRRSLLNLFRDAGVQVVFSGHEHIYQHNTLHFPADESKPAKDLHIVVTSGGGVPLRHLPADEDYSEQQKYYAEHDYDVKIVRHEREFHYCKVSVTPDDLIVEAIAVPRKHPDQQYTLEQITLPVAPAADGK